MPGNPRDFTIEMGKSLNPNGSLADPLLCALKLGRQDRGISEPYPCEGGGIPGRYVRITSHAVTVLAVCEVQVYGANGKTKMN